jgi:hypothetical protein
MDDDILVRGLHRDLVWFEMRYIHHHLFKMIISKMTTYFLRKVQLALPGMICRLP